MILWKLLVLLNILKNFFSTYLDWVFSWFLNLDLDYSWILILETWFLNLESWFLNLWNFLNSWFFGIIKIILENIASTKVCNSSLCNNTKFLFGSSPSSPFWFLYVWLIFSKAPSRGLSYLYLENTNMI